MDGKVGKDFGGDFRVAWDHTWKLPLPMLPFVWQLPSTGVLLQLHRKMEDFLLRFPKYLWFVSLANLYKSLAFVVLSSLPFFSVEGMAASFCITTILMIGMLWAFPSGHGCYWDGGREGGREDNTTTAGKLTIVWNVHPWTWGDPIFYQGDKAFC